MTLRIVPGSSHGALVRAVAGTLGVGVETVEMQRFPDGEMRPVVPELRGDDVYLVQPLVSPAGERLLELLLLVDASRRAGAARTTAVVPYFAYARQDRRTRPGEPVGVRVVAEMLAAAGADRLVVVDPHTPTLESLCRIPVESITAAGVLTAAMTSHRGRSRNLVVVAPDLGAAKLAERFAARLGGEVAIVRKTRLSPAHVEPVQVVGDVRGRATIVVDDMISTGATIEAAVRALEDAGAATPDAVLATHAVLAGNAVQRLAALPVERLIVTDTLPVAGLPVPFEVCTIGVLLADVIGRLHHDRALNDVLVRG